MALTTYAAFRAAVAGLAIADVTRTYDYPPTSVNHADLPVQYVVLMRPDSPEAHISFDGIGGWPQFRAELVVLVEPVVLNKQEYNYDDVVAMMDNVADALRDAACTIGKGPHSWTVWPEVREVVGTDYWAVVAEIVTNG